MGAVKSVLKRGQDKTKNLTQVTPTPVVSKSGSAAKFGHLSKSNRDGEPHSPINPNRPDCHLWSQFQILEIQDVDEAADGSPRRLKSALKKATAPKAKPKAKAAAASSTLSSTADQQDSEASATLEPSPPGPHEAWLATSAKGDVLESVPPKPSVPAEEMRSPEEEVDELPDIDPVKEWSRRSSSSSSSSVDSGDRQVPVPVRPLKSASIGSNGRRPSLPALEHKRSSPSMAGAVRRVSNASKLGPGVMSMSNAGNPGSARRKSLASMQNFNMNDLDISPGFARRKSR
eukprot:TRINITY_DN78544_c0_g1_i1.p1 TRINITY_DN78544_c0_g1~~TRINITY_DN78544_c0_g1_i1.p1  ORF type:complete len:288 (+),score=46.92 TRINITY_DN78544_c0_g1_i1:95-958(+)